MPGRACLGDDTFCRRACKHKQQFYCHDIQDRRKPRAVCLLVRRGCRSSAGLLALSTSNQAVPVLLPCWQAAHVACVPVVRQLRRQLTPYIRSCATLALSSVVSSKRALIRKQGSRTVEISLSSKPHTKPLHICVVCHAQPGTIRMRVASHEEHPSPSSSANCSLGLSGRLVKP